MFGIGYEVAFLNQGGALVHVYTDGSVLLNHGGVEMGQGLYTKMIQVNLSISKLFVCLEHRVIYCYFRWQVEY